MPFSKQGVAPIHVVKCGCGQTLSSINAACPKCGKNLRPLSRPEKDKPSEEHAEDPKQ